MIDRKIEKPITLVLGATPNPDRYANIATHRLLNNEYPVILIGIKDGDIAGQRILKGTPQLDQQIDTITLYVGPKHQPFYYDYLMALKPRRIIFNPGTENPELMKLCRENGIEVVVACTLVMLGTSQF